MKFYTYAVFGEKGHRQRESFSPSCAFIDWGGTATVVLNADVTGSNLYSLLILEAGDWQEADERAIAQIMDGVFENSVVGDVFPHHTPSVMRLCPEAWAKAMGFIWKKRFYGIEIPNFDLKEAALV